MKKYNFFLSYFLRWICTLIGFFLFFWVSYAQVCSVDIGTAEVFEPTSVRVWQKVDARETTLVWDIDGDGMPEVIADDYKDPGNIYVLDGQTWATEHIIPTGANLRQNNSSNGIADLDANWFGEIYFVDHARKLHRWDFDGTTRSQTWISPWLVWFATNHDRYAPHFADFSWDEIPEIYMWWDIFRAIDGVKIAAAPSAFYPWDLWWSNAFDILPDNYVFVDGPRIWSTCTDCGWLELAIWSRVFTVDIAAGTITLATEDTTWYDGRGWDAIADMDNDGDVDIIYTFSIWWDAHILVRDGQTSQQMMVVEVNAQSWWIWRPNIADFDGDGCNEIGVVSFRRYSVIDDVFSDELGCPWDNTTWINALLWGNILRFINNSDGSAVTWSSVFDFDYDGVAEVAYRDQTHMYILAWPDGTEKFKQSCTSSTRRENPVIADVNNDGQTEIVVACGAGISTFASSTDPRAPSRPVRNQHGYNITNINDDLTIPVTQNYNPTRAWWVHDSFMTQSLPVDNDFVPTNDVLPAGHIFAADAQLTILTADVQECWLSMTIDVLVENIWDASLPASTPIKVYDDDPTLFSSTAIGNGILWSTIWTWSSLLVTVPMTACSSPLYAVVNDGSTSNPYTLSWSAQFPNTSTAECAYENNIDSFQFSYCGDGILDVWEECDDPKICNDGSLCALDIDCDDDITSWLILHHQFQWGSLTDLSWNWNNGTLLWDTKIVNWRTDESINFDWYDDWMMIPHSSSTDLTNDITIAAWVYPRQFGHGQWAWDFSTILTKWAAYYLNLDASWSPQFYRYWLSTPGYHTATNPLPLNTWSHVAAIYDSVSWSVSVYVDWVLVLNAPSTWNWTQNTQNIGIGRYPGSDVRELDGAVDDVRVYDRPLSFIEIQQLHTNWVDICKSNSEWGDWCSAQCDIEYCRDDAPLNDTSKNFAITSLSPSTIWWTSTQPNSEVAICLEDTTGTRDIFYTTTDASWLFSYTPNLAPYIAPRVNVWIMLHDDDWLDIDHHALILNK